MLVVVVSLTVGAGLLAREVYRLPGDVAVPMVTVPSTSSLAPDEQPGSPTVELTPGAAAHPEHESVRQLLQTYFDAINGRSYERWMTTVTADRIQVQPRREWLVDYRSTRDGSIIVRRIETRADQRLHVLVGFTSTQDPEDAPVGLPVGCIRWNLTLPLQQENGQLKIAEVPAGTIPHREAC
ncbi:hypothetical protein SAMN05216266_12354 [Amycolatopsis marina]|uniref:Uncharacterized protein n=1 Tax=Amycolatopsis marina TaxID=490629 RepID=A0A1I1C9Z4_9PSEU|nr:hypothetical protein SAMN05216266_12354 [Amycolatopsis marina]